MNFTKTLICRDLDSSVATVQQFYGWYWYFGCWRGKFSDSTTFWRLLTPPVWQRIDWKGAQTDPDEQGFKFDTNLQFDLKVTRETRRSEVAWYPHLRRVWGGYLNRKSITACFRFKNTSAASPSHHNLTFSISLGLVCEMGHKLRVNRILNITFNIINT